MSEVGSLSWHGSQAGPLIGWPLPQILLHFYLCISLRSFAWLQKMASLDSIFSFARVTLIDTGSVHCLRFLAYPRACLPNPVVSSSSLSFHPFPTTLLLFPCHPSSNHFPPTIHPWYLIYLPFLVRFKHLPLGLPYSSFILFKAKEYSVIIRSLLDHSPTEDHLS